MLIPFSALILPALLSAVAIFLVSTIIHMVAPWHKSDYVGVPNEDGLMAAMRPFNLQPGDYMMPKAQGMDDMRSAEFKAKRRAGPAVIMTVQPSTADFSMRSNLINWFVYSFAISLIAGCVAAGARGPGADHKAVFHFVALTSFLAFGGALCQASIWFNKKWSTTLKGMLDAAIYAVITGLIFGWRWPGV